MLHCDPKRAGWLASALVFIVGAALSIALGVHTQNQQHDAIETEFLFTCTNLRISLQSTIDSFVDTLRIVATQFESSDHPQADVSWEEWQVSARKIMYTKYGLAGISWNPVVYESDRAEFEFAHQNDTIYGYFISERNASGHVVPASSDNDWPHVPVTWIEPVDANSGAIGFDLMSVEGRRNTLNEVASSGVPRATERLTLVQTGAAATLVFLPIYGNVTSAAANAECFQCWDPVETNSTWREDNIIAYITGVVEIAVLLQLGDVSDINMYAWEIADDSNVTFLAAVIDGELDWDQSDLGNPEFSTEETLTLGSREWIIRFSSSDDYYKLRQSSSPAFITSLGVLLSGLVVISIILVVRSMALGSDLLAANTSMEFLTSILDSIPCPMLVYDEQGNIVRHNKKLRSSTGYCELEMQALNVSTMMDISNDFREASLSRRGQNFAYKSRVMKKKDNEFFQARISKKRMDGCKPPLVIAVVEDLTEELEYTSQLNEAKNNAVKANEATNSFLVFVCHELRNPLHVIINMNELLSNFMTPKSEQMELLETIKSSTDVMQVIVDDVLNLKKISAGGIDLENRPFNIQRVLRDVVASHQGMLNDDVKMEVVMKGKSLQGTQLLGDETRLRQVFVNFVSNAAKFTRKGHIFVNCNVKDIVVSPTHVTDIPFAKPNELADDTWPAGYACVEFSIEDTGIGIPAKTLPHIFDVYTQAKASITREFGGTGLGLGIATGLVNHMQGEISVESVPGQGSKFSFEIIFRRDVPEESDFGSDSSSRSASSRRLSGGHGRSHDSIPDRDSLSGGHGHSRDHTPNRDHTAVEMATLNRFRQWKEQERGKTESHVDMPRSPIGSPRIFPKTLSSLPTPSGPTVSKGRSSMRLSAVSEKDREEWAMLIRDIPALQGLTINDFRHTEKFELDEYLLSVPFAKKGTFRRLHNYRLSSDSRSSSPRLQTSKLRLCPSPAQRSRNLAANQTNQASEKRSSRAVSNDRPKSTDNRRRDASRKDNQVSRSQASRPKSSKAQQVKPKSTSKRRNHRKQSRKGKGGSKEPDAVLQEVLGEDFSRGSLLDWGKKNRILVVEDVKVNQKICCGILKMGGFTTSVAENGMDAIAMVQNQSPDELSIGLILMDLTMPVMGGVESTRNIRGRGFKMPIIALTGNAMKADRIRCLDAGMTGFLAKPFNKTQLLRIVATSITNPSLITIDVNQSGSNPLKYPAKQSELSPSKDKKLDRETDGGEKANREPQKTNVKKEEKEKEKEKVDGELSSIDDTTPDIAADTTADSATDTTANPHGVTSL